MLTVLKKQVFPWLSPEGGGAFYYWRCQIKRKLSSPGGHKGVQLICILWVIVQ